MTAAEANRLVLRNDLAELERLSRWLRRWANERALASGVSFAVALCLEQAVTNVIMSCEQVNDQVTDKVEITVEIEHNAVTLVARVEDTGPQLDLGSSKVTSLDKTRIGDLGLRLMRSFASGIEYERCDDRNRLTLRFLQSEPSSVMTA